MRICKLFFHFFHSLSPFGRSKFKKVFYFKKDSDFNKKQETLIHFYNVEFGVKRELYSIKSDEGLALASVLAKESANSLDTLCSDS